MSTSNYTGVTLITPTGGRPDAFARCHEYVHRQTWHGALQWIIVDDCVPCTWVPALERAGVTSMTVIHPEPAWQPGQNTLARNLLAAIPEVAQPAVLFIEDDDWYAPDYVEHMLGVLGGCAIAGEIPARYYHAPRKLVRVMSNRHHASLCQTAISAELLPLLRGICLRPSSEFIDVRLWEAARGVKRNLVESARCVGIKGMPGRAGIGVGHRPDHGDGWQFDGDRSILRSWIGGEDVRVYCSEVRSTPA